MSPAVILRELPACACGSPATHRVEHITPSIRGGAAINHGPPRCHRCAERDAVHLLADGASSVQGRVLR